MFVKERRQNKEEYADKNRKVKSLYICLFTIRIEAQGHIMQDKS